MKTVCHLTSVHKSKDTRVYHKECRSLAEAGYDVKLVVVNGNDLKSDFKNLEIVNVHVSFKNKLSRILKAPSAVLRAALKIDADLYHFHDPELLLIANRLRVNGACVVYDSHEDVPNQIKHKSWIPVLVKSFLSWSYKYFEHQIVKKLDAVITVVDPIADRFRTVNSKVVILKNYPIIGNSLDNDSWSRREKLACYVGDLTEVRGAKTMVKSMDNTSIKLELGGSFESNELSKEVRSYSGWEKVKELGFINREKVSQVYSRCKVGLVLLHPTPSYIEALPVKLLEYMAAGLAVVGSDFGLIKAIVEKHQCGVLVDPLDEVKAGEAIMSLMNDDEKAKKMAENGRRAVEEHYSWQAEKLKLTDLYKTLLK